MNIKKVDDKPMVIHTKEKTKIHVKAQPETKIKGRNVLVVEKSLRLQGMRKRLYKTQAAKAERIKKVQAGRKIGKKTVKESA